MLQYCNATIILAATNQYDDYDMILYDMTGHHICHAMPCRTDLYMIMMYTNRRESPRDNKKRGLSNAGNKVKIAINAGNAHTVQRSQPYHNYNMTYHITCPVLV